MDQKSKLYFMGQREAVAEAAICARYAYATKDLQSNGIRPVGDPAHGSFLFECDVALYARAASLTSLTSQTFPTLMVAMSRIGPGVDFMPDKIDQCEWCTDGYINGVQVFNLSGRNERSLPADVRRLVKYVGASYVFPKLAAPRLHEIALELVLREGMSRLQNQPDIRWSPLTVAVSSQGMDGLSWESKPSTGKLLKNEAQRSRNIGIASWVDALMYGSRKNCGATPYSDNDFSGVSQRHLELLRFFGHPDLDDQKNPADTKSRSVLLDAMSSPWATLQSGEHPLIHLARVDIHAGDDEARRGLQNLIDRVGRDLNEYSEDNKTLSVQAIVRNGFKSEDIRLAMRMGTSPGRIASMLCPSKSAPPGEQISVFNGLFKGFVEFYGQVKLFPDELCRAFQHQGGVVEQCFKAQQNRELMSEVIQGESLTTVSTPQTRRRAGPVI